MIQHSIPTQYQSSQLAKQFHRRYQPQRPQKRPRQLSVCSLRKRMKSVRRSAKHFRLLAEQHDATTRLSLAATAENLLAKADKALTAVNAGDLTTANTTICNAETMIFMFRGAA